MRIFGAVLFGAALALVVAPAAAQMPNINMMPDVKSKTPEEKEADELKDKAYRDSLRKIPDAKASNDPWGVVRNDAPKAAPAKTASKAKAKPKAKVEAKTGGNNPN